MFTVDESYVYIRFDPFNNTINHILQEDDVSRGRERERPTTQASWGCGSIKSEENMWGRRLW